MAVNHASFRAAACRLLCRRGSAPPALVVAALVLVGVALSGGSRPAAAHRRILAESGPSDPTAPGAFFTLGALGDTEDAGPAVCSGFVAHCEACRFQSYGGTVTRAICHRCAPGYTVKASGRGCWCASGFFWDEATDACLPCGAGQYCPGSRATKASGAERLPCGAHKHTLTDYARSGRECVVDPGYGWGPDDAGPCPEGFFNTGHNTRRCTLCTGGLTTLQLGSTSPTDCQAPKGHYYLRGKALPCARGTYKDSAGNTDCSRCPDGLTTPPNAVAAAARTDCGYVESGYQAPAAAAGAAFALASAALASEPEPAPEAPLAALPATTLCPVDTYRGGDVQYDPSTGVSCVQCPAGMRTLEEGSESADACLAPPGYGFNSTSGSAYICPLGTYNPGWNRETCVPCGGGSITTDAPGSVSADDCKVPAGHGTTRAATGAFTAALCEVGTYGRGTDTYGLLDIACTPCMEFTTTLAAGSTTVAQCLTLPGYGWEDGGVFICDYGTWSAGYSQDPCISCGYGYTTALNGSTSPADVTMGATSPDQCVVAPGYTSMATGGLKPCPIGSYKALLGTSDCVACPAGTTTTAISAAAALSDCNACAPGFGNAVALNPEAPSCQICPSGTFAPGRVTSGPCKRCPQAPNFTGRMVSRVGISTPEGCYPEFTGDGARSFNTWDFIAMSEAALSPMVDATSVEACQAACVAAASCQYYVYRAAELRCLLRNKVPYSRVNVSDTSKSYALFEVSPGRYVAYEAHPSDAESLGQPLGAFPSLRAAVTACGPDSRCIGIKFMHDSASADKFQTFRGTLWEGVTGKVRVAGENIDPWVAPPTST